MDKFTNYCAINIAVCVLLLAACVSGLWYTTSNNSKENREPAAGEVISPTYQVNSPDDHALPQSSNFNTDYLDSWCGEPIGQIRMIGGWYHDENIIETEDGNLWELNTESINEWELLLIWFDDMGTPEIEDDEIIKVWSEVYD